MIEQAWCFAENKEQERRLTPVGVVVLNMGHERLWWWFCGCKSETAEIVVLSNHSRYVWTLFNG